MTEYALRLHNGQDTAPRVRFGDALGLYPDGPLEAFAGLRPDGGGDVVVNDGSMSVTVLPFLGWVDGASSTAQGGYPFVLDEAKTLTVTDGDGSLTRTDLVVAQVRDTVFDNTGATDARVRLVEGAPGGGAPAVPDGAVPLWELDVPPGASAGSGGLSPSALSTDRRRWLSSVGGVRPVVDAADRDAAQVQRGAMVYRIDTDELEVLTSSGWQPLRPEDDTGWVSLGQPSGHWVAGTTQPSVRRIGNRVSFRGYIQRGDQFQLLADGSWSSVYTLPSEFRPPEPRHFYAMPNPNNPQPGHERPVIKVRIATDGTVDLANVGYGNPPSHDPPLEGNLQPNANVSVYEEWLLD